MDADDWTAKMEGDLEKMKARHLPQPVLRMDALPIFDFPAAKVRVYPSRKLVDIFNMTPEDIELADIARGLSRQCRYNGHVEGFVSVAEHCIQVASILAREGHGPEVQAQGLLHDAAEAYIGDLVGPLKHTAVMEPFRDMERQMEAVIAQRFGLPERMHSAVKAADVEAGTIERGEQQFDVPTRDRPIYMAPGIEVTERIFLQYAAALDLS